MSRSPNPGTGTTIFLYIFGIFFLISAVLVVLKGAGILQNIPDYLIWASVLVSLGAGILTALKNISRRY